MKYLKSILSISLLILLGKDRISACGQYFPDNSNNILMFRSCSPQLEKQWHDGCRFQEYEKEQNCLLWQHITSATIPLEDIKKVVYEARLSDLKELTGGELANNQFARWLSSPKHKEDLDYLMTAKEIEEIREYLNDPWYYPYDNDYEHERLSALKERCLTYSGKRHASRYALQLVRLYFAVGDFKSCIDLWENKVSTLPATIVTDMIASYAGGAYFRKGNRDKAIELFTRSQDIGSLINLKAWKGAEDQSAYSDDRIKELEYIFNRFPNSPLLSVKLQEYVRNRESYVNSYADWEKLGFHGPTAVKSYWDGDSLVIDDESAFYNELKSFAQIAAKDKKCRQKGMWNYALSYLYYLDGDYQKASSFLNRAEQAESSPFISNSIRALRFFMNTRYANNSQSYKDQLFKDLKWLDYQLSNDIKLNPKDNWQYDNKMNWKVCYWQDVARKVLLGMVVPKMKQSGNSTLALQLANYASNRIYQLAPLYEAHHYGYDDPDDQESYTFILPIDEYRENCKERNFLDWQSQFFEVINNSTAEEAAGYAQRINSPKTPLDKFLNERSYINSDYINDIVGTLYLRQMDYDKAVQWLSKVSPDYQNKTNLGKYGYFVLDPFRFQSGKEHFIKDSNDYKLKFAQEMVALQRLIESDAEVNRKAMAKTRFAIGLRNSFGKCWCLTDYSFETVYDYGKAEDWYLADWKVYTSEDRGGFKDNPYAQKAYQRVDTLMEEALSEFTNEEIAAQAQLDMLNFATIIKKYPDTRAASFVRSRCDNYYDYALQKR